MQNARIQQDPVRSKQPLRSWFDVRNRRLGGWAFVLNRLTGLALVVYLLIHLVILSLLLQGEAGWDEFIALARSPWFLALDVVLIFGILFHGLNGIRVTLVGLGIGVNRQRAMFWALTVIGVALLGVSAWLVFTI